MRHAIINADDFGLHQATNEGIVRGMTEGLISSTSIMACGSAFEHAVSLVKAHHIFHVGIHLVLDEETPLLPPEEIPSLVTPDGHFLNRGTLLKRLLFSNRIKLAEVEKEFRAQITRCRSNGLSLSHLDGHGHVHVYPRIAPLVSSLAEEYGIERVRMPLERLSVMDLAQFKPAKYVNKCIVAFFALNARRSFLKHHLRSPRGFMGMLHGGNLNARNLNFILSRLPKSDVIEIMTHPAVSDASLEQRYQHWQYNWQSELDSMLSMCKAGLEESHSLRLVPYSKL